MKIAVCVVGFAALMIFSAKQVYRRMADDLSFVIPPVPESGF